MVPVRLTLSQSADLSKHISNQNSTLTQDPGRTSRGPNRVQTTLAFATQKKLYGIIPLEFALFHSKHLRCGKSGSSGSHKSERLFATNTDSEAF